ncbi:MAG TPA: hypothetical protein VFQ44_02490 [Streptosporangiaceae bacterium]|nr:hypothetical protein [Streptosporangiaceae bacterium]
MIRFARSVLRRGRHRKAPWWRTMLTAHRVPDRRDDKTLSVFQAIRAELAVADVLAQLLALSATGPAGMHVARMLTAEFTDMLAAIKYTADAKARGMWIGA